MLLINYSGTFEKEKKRSPAGIQRPSLHMNMLATTLSRGMYYRHVGRKFACIPRTQGEKKFQNIFGTFQLLKLHLLIFQFFVRGFPILQTSIPLCLFLSYISSDFNDVYFLSHHSTSNKTLHLRLQNTSILFTKTMCSHLY